MKQVQALKVLDSGSNVFLTGSPGSGKTYVLNKFIGRAKKRRLNVAITATTGIAATHLSGITIHSWSGIGINSSLNDQELKKLKNNKKIVSRYRQTDVLVIDEISMLDGQRLDLIDNLAKKFRKSELAFGGLQVVLVGDLFQLPPVSRDSEVFDFVYKAKAWRQLDLKVCYLAEQHRQNANDGYNDILEAIRLGRPTSAHLLALNSRRGASDHLDKLTKLYAHNYDVDQENNLKLKSLLGEEHLFSMSLSGSRSDTDRLKASILAPEQLVLKQECEVMFIVNNPKSGYVNGSRGRVVDFKNGLPIVKLTDGKYVEVKQHDWQVEVNGEIVASAMQLPLRLAWAITIHKSQGMSLDAAEIDLSHAFTPGMGYVALSRLKSLDGLYLKDMNKLALRVNTDILVVDRYLRLLSDRQLESLQSNQ